MAAATLCSSSASLSQTSQRRFSQQLPSLAVPLQHSRGRRGAVRVQAEFNAPMRAAPKGITQPPREPQVPPARFGFNDNAERLNSRACMIGFFGLILVEAISGKGFLQLVGIQIGRGIGFEI